MAGRFELDSEDFAAFKAYYQTEDVGKMVHGLVSEIQDRGSALTGRNLALEQLIRFCSTYARRWKPYECFLVLMSSDNAPEALRNSNYFKALTERAGGVNGLVDWHLLAAAAFYKDCRASLEKHRAYKELKD